MPRNDTWRGCETTRGVAEGLGPWRAPGTTGGVSSNERDRSGLERNLGGVGRSHCQCEATEVWSFVERADVGGFSDVSAPTSRELERSPEHVSGVLPDTKD